MAQEEYDEFMGGGNFKGFPFDKEGDAILGTILEPPEKLQQTDINTKELKFWDDGKPKWYFRIKLQTTLREDEDDNGIRSLSLSWKRLEAVREAVRAAGEKNLKVGGQLWLRFDKFEDKQNAKFRSNPAKVGWTAKYKPPVAEPEFMNDDPFGGDGPPVAEQRAAEPTSVLGQMAARRGASGRMGVDVDDIPTPNLDAVRAKIAAAGPTPDQPPF